MAPQTCLGNILHCRVWGPGSATSSPATSSPTKVVFLLLPWLSWSHMGGLLPQKGRGAEEGRSLQPCGSQLLGCHTSSASAPTAFQQGSPSPAQHPPALPPQLSTWGLAGVLVSAGTEPVLSPVATTGPCLGSGMRIMLITRRCFGVAEQCLP